MGFIRGAGNGRDLVAAVPFAEAQDTSFTILFAESHDGGKTWTTRTDVVSRREGGKDIQGLVLIPQSGRVLLIFTDQAEEELRIVTRSPGSAVFSAEITLDQIG